MKKGRKFIFGFLSVFLFLNSLSFAETPLKIKIVELEFEISQMENKLGDYKDMDDAKLQKLLSQKKKELEKAKIENEKQNKKNSDKLKKDFNKGKKDLKKGIDNSGKDFKKAGKKIKNGINDLFD